MESTSKSGWLSREQQAASEFARRVAVKHGIGVVAATMKRKEDQVRVREQRNKKKERVCGTNARACVEPSPFVLW